MSPNEKPRHEYIWAKDDFSDVLAPRPDVSAELEERRTNVSVNRWLFVCLLLNVLVTAAAAFFVVQGLAMLPGKAYLPVLLALVALFKLGGSAFLFFYWKSLDPKIARTTPLLAATLNLIPVVDLVWFFVAILGGIADGIKTVESLDGNRMLLRAPTKLAWTFYATYLGALAFFIYHVAVLFQSGKLSAEALGSQFDFNEIVSIVFLAGMFASNLFKDAALLNLGLFLTVTAAASRLAFMHRMLVIARYVNDVRRIAEPHATAQEREDEKARLGALFGASHSSAFQKESSADDAGVDNNNEAK